MLQIYKVDVYLMSEETEDASFWRGY